MEEAVEVVEPDSTVEHAKILRQLTSEFRREMGKEIKAKAARRNGAKGGRPRKEK